MPEQSLAGKTAAHPTPGLGKAIVWLLDHQGPGPRPWLMPGRPGSTLVANVRSKGEQLRKNSPGCKAMPGAHGMRDGIVSRMHTCQLGGSNPFDQLTALQVNSPAAVPASTNQTRRSRRGVKSSAAPAPRTLTHSTRCSSARRGFVDAAKLAPLDPLPVEVLGRFHQLYEVERNSRAAQHTAAQRLWSLAESYERLRGICWPLHQFSTSFCRRFARRCLSAQQPDQLAR